MTTQWEFEEDRGGETVIVTKEDSSIWDSGPNVKGMVADFVHCQVIGVSLKY